MKLKMGNLKFKFKLKLYILMKRFGITNTIDYIGVGETLPPPLNAEEEEYYISNLKSDESIKTVLIERNLRLVVYIARKFDNTKIAIEDLISIGTIGLIKAEIGRAHV